MGLIDGFMRLNNWFMQRSMKKEAQRLAKQLAVLYRESKAKNPSASEAEVIRAIVFDNEALSRMSESTRRRVETSCETVQGLCYMAALDMGSLKRLMPFRAVQFTRHMDIALEAQGFPSQSREQKERILEAMELRFDGWDEWSGECEVQS